MEITIEHDTLSRIVYMLSETEVKEALVSSVRRVRGVEIPGGGLWTFAWFRNENGRLCVELTQTFKETQGEGGQNDVLPDL